MRLTPVLIGLNLTIVTAAHAADRPRYVNVRFGYTADIPAEFKGQGESDNGDGQVFIKKGAALRLWGGQASAGFTAESRDRLAWDRREGLVVTYKTLRPNSASWAGRKGDRIVYQRMIALCGGSTYAAFKMDYAQADAVRLDPVIRDLVRSLKVAGVCHE